MFHLRPPERFILKEQVKLTLNKSFLQDKNLGKC